jgi:hypothetical protein
MFTRPAGAPGGLGIATTLAQHVSRWLRSGLPQQAEHISWRRIAGYVLWRAACS